MPKHFFIFALALTLSSCDSGPEEPPEFVEGGPREITCSFSQDEITSGGIGRDVIPALTDPSMTGPEEAFYLADEDRVLGFLIEDQAYAVPHNILWFHEIVNLNLPTEQLAVTYCPLTGSGMLYDRAAIGGNEFGVSGLLLQNNLVMFDRTQNESLWPQMSRRADCGPKIGASLTMLPMLDIRWDRWKALYPETLVLSNETGYGIGYTSVNYPYGNYEDPDNDGLLFDMEIDPRRPPKERLLGVPDSRRGGTVFPFGELDNGEPVNVVHQATDAGFVVVFWDNAAQTAMAYSPRLNGESLQFEVQEGKIVDMGTGSVWRVDGLAVEGEMAGSRLEPVENAYVAFWFAWAAFHPETVIWAAQ